MVIECCSSSCFLPGYCHCHSHVRGCLFCHLRQKTHCTSLIMLPRYCSCSCYQLSYCHSNWLRLPCTTTISQSPSCHVMSCHGGWLDDRGQWPVACGLCLCHVAPSPQFRYSSPLPLACLGAYSLPAPGDFLLQVRKSRVSRSIRSIIDHHLSIPSAHQLTQFIGLAVQ